MSEPKDQQDARVVETKDTKDRSTIQQKEQRGAYLGPKGPPVEMTGDIFIDPTPTVTPAAPPPAPPPAPAEGDGGDA